MFSNEYLSDSTLDVGIAGSNVCTRNEYLENVHPAA
jgi:hypothetical protein